MMRLDASFRIGLVLVGCLGTATLAVADGPKSPVAPADYGKWETLGPGQLSPDGKWLVHGITRVDGKNELRIRDLGGPEKRAIGFGSAPAFSDDSRWLACEIGVSEEERAALTKAKKPVPRKVGLFNLANLETTVVDNVGSFAFSRGGAYLAMHRPAAPKAETPPADPGVDLPATGSDLIVRDLARGVDATFGNVAAMAWQDRDGGHLLALIVQPEGDAGRGVHLYDPSTGVLRVLDSGPASYSGLAWRKDSDDLAALRSKASADFEEETQVVLAWRGLDGPKPDAKTFDPTTSPGFPADTRVVPYLAPAWASTGETIFVGTRPRTKKPPKEKDKDAEKEKGKEKPEVSDVEVWHSKDVRIIPEQKLRADRDRKKSTLAAWWLADGKFVPLGGDWAEEVTPLKGGQHALAVDETPHDPSRMFGRPYSDAYLVDTRTGGRRVVAEHLRFLLGASPEGRYVLYFRDDHYWAFDVRSGETVELTKGAPTSFANREDDHPAPERSPYSVGFSGSPAAWTKGDASILIHDRYDLWEARLDGPKLTRLTAGAEEEVEHRLVPRFDPREESVDPSKPLYLTVHGEWTKKQGLARLDLGDGPKLERVAWLDKSVGRLIKARSADVLAYVVQSFDDPPDYFACGADLKGGRQVSETNPFQGDYAWGRAELVEYKNARGERLQGILHYPAGFEPGKTYPMIVYVYEKLSRNLHNYAVPSDRSPYNPAVFTAKGYFFLSPDITFRPRDPGISALDAIESAVGKVLGLGHVDPKRVGLVGHSWGGYETAFLATRSSLFAAAVAGAPLTDLLSMYGSVYWNSGQPETGHYEVGQERMQVPLWDDPDAYLRNSPVLSIPAMKAPLLMAFGDKDGAVDWHQGIEMYNLARRAGKQFVLLVYPGENHSLAKKPNQLDYQRRILDWFGHYLKGETAPDWITKGVGHLDAERARKSGR
jgi:dipeptidyl aminopeptidase/acylaminoacyl peptidase